MSDAPFHVRPLGGRRAKVVPPPTPDMRNLTTLAGSVVVVAGLYLGRDVLIPVTLAILLSLVLSPLVRLLRRAKLGRVGSVFLAVFVALGVILTAAGIIGAQLADLAQNIPLYQSTIQQKVETAREMTLGRIGEVLERLGSGFRQNQPAGPDAPSAAAPRMGQGESPPPLPVEVHEPEMTPAQMVSRLASPVLAPLVQTGIVLIVTIFVLLQREDLRDRLIRLFGSTDLHRTTVAMDDAAYRLSRFFLAQLSINVGFGAVVGIGLMVIGVPSPLLWGILAALLRFIPYIGAPLGAVLPIALAAAVEPGWSMALWTAALFLAIEPIVAHVVEPLAYGHSTGLSPVSVVIAAIFWSWIWGPIGLLLGTPLTLCLVVLGRHVDRLEFLDVLLGDRPALTPVENFYQRMLAGDPDEAQEQAEALLRERSLRSYYDEVALKGLAMATHDVRRGWVTPEQLERIREAVMDLSEALDDYPDAEPPPSGGNGASRMLRLSNAEQKLPREPAVELPDSASLPEAWRRNGAILCVPGRGPLDETSAQLLAQILRKHGFGVRVVPHQAISRREIESLETEGVQMVCACVVSVPGAPSQLRYIARRMRQRLPQVPILAGIWADTEAMSLDEGARRMLDVQHVVSTFQAALLACSEVAMGEEVEA